MPLPPLAQPHDILDALPSGFNVETPRLMTLLADASAAVRRYTKRNFTRQQITVKTRPIGYRVKLVKKPVISVDSVAVWMLNNPVPVAFPGWWWDGDSEIWLIAGDTFINLAEELTFALDWQTPNLQVVYTCGDIEVPEDIVGVIRSMVLRLVTAPGLGGVISESVGEYSYRLSDTAAQGTMALTEAEKDILKDYRPKNNRTIELRG